METLTIGARSMLNVPKRNCLMKVHNRGFLRSLFKGWGSQRVIYPPSPSEITTQNRLFPTYVSTRDELQDLILGKDPLILNFTYADAKSNNVTKSLFDLLSDKEKYPLNFPVSLANVWADTPGGRELMLNYAVGKIPGLVLLKKQIRIDSFTPNVESFKELDLLTWISKIKK